MIFMTSGQEEDRGALAESEEGKEDIPAELWGGIGPIEIVVFYNGKKFVQKTTIAEMAMYEALKRLAPDWCPYPHRVDMRTRQVMAWLITDTELRVSLGGPDFVDAYTRDFLYL